MTELQQIWEDGDQPTSAELEWFYGANGDHAAVLPEARPWVAEPWAVFRDTAEEEIDWQVEGLLPAGSFAFVAAPPKKGKTWIALYTAVCLATGTSLFQTFRVPDPVPGLYVALEGSRSALRARTGALARGIGIDPDGEELERLHFLYRPRPFDLARPESAEWLEAQVEELQAEFVVVDVLRAAARFRENVAEDFAVVRDSFEGMLRAGVTIAVLHHFGKLNDTNRDRSPGERMAGTGAMYGALDVGLLITQSENGARRLRIDVDARDFAAPEALGIVLEGTGTGEHGGFRYTDTARYVLDASAAEERDVVGEIERLFADRKWRTIPEIAAKPPAGIGIDKAGLLDVLEKHPERFARIEGELARSIGRSAQAKPWGVLAMRDELDLGPNHPRHFSSPGGYSTAPSTGGVVPKGTTTSRDAEPGGVESRGNQSTRCRECGRSFKRGTGNRGDLCRDCAGGIEF